MNNYRINYKLTLSIHNLFIILHYIMFKKIEFKILQKIHAEKPLAENKKITDKNIVQVVDQIEKGDEERTEEAQIIDQTLNYQEIKNTIQITDQTDEEVKIKMKEERARIVDKENEEEPVLKKEIKEDNQIEATTAAPTTVLKKTKRESEVAS